MISAVTLLVCLNGLDNSFLLDDRSKIIENADIRDLGNLAARLVYPYEQNQRLNRNDPSRPLTFLFYTLAYQLAGPSPRTFHLLNVLVHVLAALVVFLLCRRIFAYLREPPSGSEELPGSRKAKSKHRLQGAPPPSMIAPLMVALLFAVSPIQLGTVMYAYGLSDLLSGLFTLLAIYLFVVRARPAGWQLLFALFCMALALGAKQSAAIIPIFLLLVDVLIVGGGRLTWLRGRLRLHAGFWLLTGLYLIARYAFFGGLGDLEAGGNTHPALPYLFVEPTVIFRYLWLAVIPHNLAIDHAVYPASYGVGLKLCATFALSALLVALLMGLVRLPTERRMRIVAFGLLFYLLALAPTSSLLPTVDVMVERRTYLANVGLFLLVVLLYDLIGSVGVLGEEKVHRAALVVFVIHLSVLAALSVVRNRAYATPASAWADVLRVYPKSVRAINNLANAQIADHDYEQARARLEWLAARDPTLETFASLGSLYEKEGTTFRDEAKALELFQRALAAGPTHPGRANTLYNLGRLLQKRGEVEQARAHYLEALQLDPSHALAHNNLALLLFRQGQVAEAKQHWTEALEVDPSCEPAINNMKTFFGPDGKAREDRPHQIAPSQVPLDIVVQLYDGPLRKGEDGKVRQAAANLCRLRGKEPYKEGLFEQSELCRMALTGPSGQP